MGFSYKMVNMLTSSMTSPVLDDKSTTDLVFCKNTSQVSDSKQEAHGPHRSPEKTVQINKHK